MKLKVPKTERRRPQDSRLRRILRRVLIIALVVGLMGLAATHLLALITGYDVLAVPEEGVSAVMTPLQSGFSAVVDWVVDYLYTLKLRSRIELEYNRLKTENEQLVYDAMLAEEMQHKLSVYENLYDEISVNESLNPLVATVIGRDSGNYFSVFTINKGSNDGVEDYMAVTMDGAMVGYTYNVTPTKSTVRTIIDSEASIAALIQSSRDQGTVRGTLGVDGTPLCRMYYLPEDNLPRPGDVVVTQDIGLASMVLGRGAQAIGVRGHVYSPLTIDAALFVRHEEKKVRRAGGRTKGPDPFCDEDRERFVRNLERLLRQG